MLLACSMPHPPSTSLSSAAPSPPHITVTVDPGKRAPLPRQGPPSRDSCRNQVPISDQGIPISSLIGPLPGVLWWRWLTLKVRRSQIRKVPSSAPEASMQVARLFHEMTFTSVACAVSESAGWCRVRVSQMRRLLSTEQLANTVASVGDHCRSSTLAVWPTNGAASTAHLAPLVGSHRKMPPRQSPAGAHGRP